MMSEEEELMFIHASADTVGLILSKGRHCTLVETLCLVALSLALPGARNDPRRAQVCSPQGLITIVPYHE